MSKALSKNQLISLGVGAAAVGAGLALLMWRRKRDSVEYSAGAPIMVESKSAPAPGSPMVTAEWLAQALSDKKTNVKVVDCSWYLPNQNRNSREEYRNQRIPGAVFLDLDEVATDLTVGGQAMPHMLPSAQQWSAALASLGIYEGDHIVAYDQSGIFTGSARFWWTCKALGATSKVSILDGGFKAWKDGNNAIHGPSDPRPAFSKLDRTRKQWHAKLDSKWLRTMDQMMENIQKKRDQVLDARSAGRWAGTEPEPRSVKRQAHIPGALSFPHVSVHSNGYLKPVDELRKIFSDKKVNLNQSVCAYCGSGMTAAIVVVALTACGARDVSLYDGSWTEWGNSDRTASDSYNERPAPRDA